MRKIRNVFVLLCGVLSFCRIAYAANSVGFDVTGGVGSSGFDTNGSLDIKAEDVKNPYEASLSYAHLHTTAGTESRTNQYTIGVDHEIDDNWGSHLNATYWKDTLNNIHYGGPTTGFNYTWTEGGSTEPAPKDEIASISVNADLFFYGTEVFASSTTRRVFDQRLHRFITRVVPPGSGTEKVTQFHPNFTAENTLDLVLGKDGDAGRRRLVGLGRGRPVFRRRHADDGGQRQQCSCRHDGRMFAAHAASEVSGNPHH